MTLAWPTCFLFFSLPVCSLSLLPFWPMIDWWQYVLPLRYHAIITMPAMAVILTMVWSYDSVILIITVSLVTRLSFCKSIAIKSYFCDHGPTCILACSDYSLNRNMGIVIVIGLFCIPFIFIVLSYVFIVHALFKIASWEGRFKAMKTCSAHLMLVTLYYLPMLGTYITALQFYNSTIQPNVRIMSTSLAKAITPMMNPIIYVLNTEEVKEFAKKLFRKKK